MDLQDFTFIAIDLETTGLDPEKDTIIEIAAVRFHLERDGDVFCSVYEDERSMLIDPKRPLEENISMITHITDDMLTGKPVWGDVRERVKSFIGDGIIIGHNVLFDVSMLRSHGIDLMGNIILDTFELSEIFSYDVESLNLGFLSKKYNINVGSEHRALDDTKLSVGLFIHYLGELVRSIDIHSLWHDISMKDPTHTLSTISEIAQIVPISRYRFYKGSQGFIPFERKGEKETREYSLISLSGEENEEKNLIQEIKGEGKILVVTQDKKEAKFLGEVYSGLGCDVSIYRSPWSYISLDIYFEWLEKSVLSRKEAIFLLKISYWLRKTSTGILDEMKFYGEERSFMEHFREVEGIDNPFFIEYENKRRASPVTIASIQSLGDTPIMEDGSTLMVRDIGLMDDTLRRKKSTHISTKNLFSILEDFSDLLGESYSDSILGASILIDIISSTPERPQGENEVAPGEYGETYFMTQKDIWHRGHRWLSFARMHLERGLEGISKKKTHSKEDEKKLRNVRLILEKCIRLSFEEEDNLSIILSVTKEDTMISLIPRNMQDEMEQFLTLHGGMKNILTGYGISKAKVAGFLSQALSISGKIQENNEAKIIQYQENPIIEGSKIVFLTTSTKHIRSLKKDLEKTHTGYKIYAQGLSGGKGKMLSLFLEPGVKTILIGLIDTWQDERDLWKYTDTLFISKIPFDPPSDPYFLARTVGMKNNFEEYSTPMAIITLNTLIGKARGANSRIQIFSIDDRIMISSWGKSLYNELL